MIYNILLVEDDAVQAGLMSKVINEKMHYHTVVASSGTEAIDKLTEKDAGSFDLVVLDLAMPGMDGVEVLHAVKPLKPHLPFIIRSGYDDAYRVVEAMQAGAVDFIKKIDNINTLCDAIGRALEKRDIGVGATAIPPGTFLSASQMEALLHQHTENILNLEEPTGHVKTLTEIEKEVIVQALKRYHYHMSKVAKHLGIGRSTLYRKLDEYHLHPKDYDA